MEKEFKKIKVILNRLHDLQANHLASFDKAYLPDLEKQSEQRNIEVEKLMKRVGKLVKLSKSKRTAETESLLIFLNDRITELLEQNNALATKASEVRNNIKNNMKKISKGTKVIGSYRSSKAASCKTRVINITN
jgi:chaperonin cofactor prefoldin